MRSTEVEGVLGLFFGRPDGFGSSDFAPNVDLFMLYRSIWVSGADSMRFILETLLIVTTFLLLQARGAIIIIT